MGLLINTEGNFDAALASDLGRNVKTLDCETSSVPLAFELKEIEYTAAKHRAAARKIDNDNDFWFMDPGQYKAIAGDLIKKINGQQNHDFPMSYPVDH